MPNLTSPFKNFFHRHRRLVVTLGIIFCIYLIIRLFFTPPLLRDTHFSRAYYDRNGQLLRLTLTADDKYRLYTPLDKISPDLIAATILYEDKYFYYHPGVNPVSLFNATLNYFSGAPHPAGASTITMQTARLKYNLDTKTPVGKLIQIAAAIYIDLFYSKSEIIEAYLNLAPYGGNIEGIATASLIYFDTPASDLTKISAISLSTIPQNPSKRGLNTPNGINNIFNMRQDLVKRWIGRHPTDTDLIQLAKMPLNTRRISDLPFLAPHFTDRLIKSSPNYWHDIGARPSEIRTTLDYSLQSAMTHTLRSQISRRHASGVQNAAAILVNYKTMETLAYIGSTDYHNEKIFGQNDGVFAKRSPASTLKPLIYAMACDYGLIHPMTLLKDAKINFGVYAPENADNRFYGPVLARDALTHSRNIPAINLIQKLGARNFYNTLNKFEISGLKSPDHYGISIALGGAELSMFELANIYTTMANLGQFKRIKFDTSTPDETIDHILSAEAFFLTLDMLASNPPPKNNIPFATAQPTPKIQHYWKTGTSSSYRDAWTAGIFGDYVLIVWVGNFDGTPNNVFSGARTAAPIYFALADTVIDYFSNTTTPVHNNDFLSPDMNIAQLDMCDTVGGIANAQCPKTIKSYFIPGVSPIDTTSIYRTIPIDNATGLRACTRDPNTTHMETFEFWDAEFLDMFASAGITRNTPPPFMPNCNLDEISNASSAPIITHPIADTKTVITNDATATPIAYQAISTNRTDKIYWFLNSDMIGTTISGQTFTHPTPMGDHTLRIATESGTGTSINFTVTK